MSAAQLRTLALTEVRLRLRRPTTWAALLVAVALGWAMIADPAGGMTLLAVEEARVRYTSSVLALGSAALGGLLLGLGGFFLVRGRVGEDLRSGAGSVIAATPVGNARLLLSRWLGGVAYLALLIAAFMVTMMLCHGLRGEGPLEPWVYLKTFSLQLLPTAFFTVSCAVLFDSWAPLMGKRGDVLYFLLWVAQLSLSSQLGEAPPTEIPGSLAFDFPGIAMAMATLQLTLHTSNISLGGASFDASLPMLTLSRDLWTAESVGLRLGSAAIALLPLLPAALLFHRFSPDRVRASQARRRRSPLTLLNGLLRPLSRLVQPLFALAARVPGPAGQVLAELALSFTAAPAALAALLLLVPVSLLSSADALGPLLAAAVALWGVLVSDLSTRDAQADTAGMTGVVPGGLPQRDLRHFSATLALGLLFTGTIAARWVGGHPVRALAVVTGLFALSAFATLLGRLTRTPRTFLVLFLFGLYVALNAPKVPLLDVVGFNGAATLASVLSFGVAGALVLGAGFAWHRRVALQAGISNSRPTAA